MEGSLEVLTATAGQTAADVLAVSDNQAKLGQTLQSGLAGLDGRTATVAENQQRMQGSMDALTTTAGQTAADVIAVNNRQDAIVKAIQSHEESSAAGSHNWTTNQQKMQSGLDAVTTTADRRLATSPP